jgi:hypothetical protein
MKERPRRKPHDKHLSQFLPVDKYLPSLQPEPFAYSQEAGKTAFEKQSLPSANLIPLLQSKSSRFDQVRGYFDVTVIYRSLLVDKYLGM